MSRKLLACLMLSWMMPYALCQGSSPPKPLTAEEKRQIYGQLLELRDLKAITIPEFDAKVAELQMTIEEKDKAMREAVAAKEVEISALEKERDTYKSQVDFYKAAAAIKPMHGAKRFFCKFFTIGIGACR